MYGANRNAVLMLPLTISVEYKYDFDIEALVTHSAPDNAIFNTCLWDQRQLH